METVGHKPEQAGSEEPMRTLVLSVVTIMGLLAWLGAAAAGSIYDPPIERHLTLTPEQRPHVERILSQSRQQFLAVLHAHGIDPYGPPIFRQLVRASPELLAISRQQRREMRRVLRPDQFAEYNRIMKDTRTRIRAAAQ
jgi:hypothetical protein